MSRRLNGICCAGLLSAVVVCSGCALTSSGPLEASLRQQEARLRELERELTVARRQLREQEQELQALRTSQYDSPFHVTSSGRPLEAAVAWGAVHALRIHSLVSGVIRGEGRERVVSAIVQPVDIDGEPLKVAGDLTLQVQLPGEDGIIAETTLSALESRAAWSSGIVARGFQVELPLPAETVDELAPGDQVLLTATFRLSPQREFQATALLRVPEEPESF